MKLIVLFVSCDEPPFTTALNSLLNRKISHKKHKVRKILIKQAIQAVVMGEVILKDMGVKIDQFLGGLYNRGYIHCVFLVYFTK